MKLSSSGSADVTERLCVLEIQDTSQITGSPNNSADFTNIHVVPKTIQGFTTTYETYKSPRYLVSKIQDGSKLTGSTNMSETMTYYQNSKVNPGVVS